MMKNLHLLLIIFVCLLFFVRYALIEIIDQFHHSNHAREELTPRQILEMASLQRQQEEGGASTSSFLSFSPIPTTFHCDDPVFAATNMWCSVPRPEKSLFRFPDGPIDPEKWKIAQEYAILKKPLLLERIIRYFPNENNFLDGDVLFRKYHHLGDYFVDENYHFDILNYSPPSSLSSSSAAIEPSSKNSLRSSSSSPSFTQQPEELIEVFQSNLKKMLNSKDRKKYEYETQHHLSRREVLPDPTYPFYHLQRAPILHMGYFVFPRKNNHDRLYFTGNQQGEVIIDRAKLFELWLQSMGKGNKDKKNLKSSNVDFPWIGIHAANENWGLFSTYFPNRTTNWGYCCSKEIQTTSIDITINEFLNHNKTIMFITNQHHNITHRKLITLPRGIPIQFQHVNKLLYDSMYTLLNPDNHQKLEKDNLLFTSSSNWGYRPKIIECIHQKFLNEPNITWNNYNEKLKGRLSPEEYYLVLGKSLFSFALPGLGYDTFRLWETLTVGSIPILEKGIGLDKTLWKLPALLVEDFDEVTPQLLRQAYLEALYHVDEFEFERLTQSWWFDFILNVSKSMNSETILEKFPLESEDYDFTRPLQPFDCQKTNSCGVGTKRIPKSFC